jgi:molecular chaperone DnaJ
MQHHPDRNPNDKAAEDRFKAAASAYDVLSNPEKRARYDRFGHAAFANGGGQGGFHSAEDIFSSFSDIFGDFFGGAQQRGGRRRHQGPARGSDLRYVCEIELRDAVKGLERDIEFDTDESCADCSGSGAKTGTQAETCATCGGAGQVVAAQGFFSVATTCPGCQGSGRIVRHPCPACHGKGRSRVHRKIRVTVPAGVDSGTQLRVSNEGEGGYRNGPPGDLYVEIRVKEDERFERHGVDLLGRVSVSYAQALLGAEVEVETYEGPEKLIVPHGTRHGERVRIEKRGIPSLRGGARGHLYFEVEVEFPKKLKKEEERLLRELAKIRGDDVLASKKGLFS